MPSQHDHDRAVRFIAASRFPFPGQTDWPPDNLTLTNETERKKGIAGPDGTHYPDIVIVSKAGQIREVAEIETEVSPARARIWAASSAASDNGTKTGVKHFFVYVRPARSRTPSRCSTAARSPMPESAPGASIPPAASASCRW